MAELLDKLAVSNRLHVYVEQQAAVRCQPHLMALRLAHFSQILCLAATNNSLIAH